MSDLVIKKEEILSSAKSWCTDSIAKNHIKNTAALSKSKKFNINPFLIGYLAKFLDGEITPKSVARALIIPRAMSTSINTSFGQNTQKFTSKVLPSLGSAVSGIDIEFIDQLDGRKKYCQLKAGPNTINSGDVETINGHFRNIKNLAKTNSLPIGINDLIVGVIYGSKLDLSSHYKDIENKYDYPVIVGQDFWHRLTGDDNFYHDLIDAISSAAAELDGSNILNETIDKLSKDEAIINLAK